jgi:hypothetical protein
MKQLNQLLSIKTSGGAINATDHYLLLGFHAEV